MTRSVHPHRFRPHALRLVLGLACLLPAWPAHARCFDFNTKVTTPLRAPPPLPAKGDAADSGHRADGVVWGRVRGTVAKSPARVLALLLDHETMRSSEIDEMHVKKSTSPNYLARHTVNYEVRPFPLVKIRWTEEWGYAVAEGPDEAPTAYVISYEKVEGTSHIAHFCGNIVLRRLSATETDVYHFEESKATRHSEEDQLQGLKRLAHKLRTLP